MIKHAMRAAVAALALVSVSLPAHGFKAGDIVIGHPWARETPPHARSGAGYLTLTNTGKADERLLGGSSPVATGFDLHETSSAGGVMRMRKLDKGVTIRPGETVTIAPGGMHIMLIGLRQPLVAGTMVPATLRFEHAGAVAIDFKVRTIDAPVPDHAAMDHGK